MVNHLRTLLLNESASPGCPGEQYIDPDFRPLALPPEAATVQHLLLPNTSPRSYRNFVATLLTRVAYQGNFVAELNRLDPRTTLDFSGNLVDTLQDATTISGEGSAVVNCFGQFVPNAAAGIFAATWRIVRVDDQHARVIRDGQEVLAAFSWENDVSNVLILDPRGPLSLQLVGRTSVPPLLDVTIQASCAPNYDLIGALQRLRGDSSPLQLLDGLGDSGMAASLKDAFLNSDRPDVALAALLVGYVLLLS